MSPLIDYSQALTLTRQLGETLGRNAADERVATAEAVGRVLAEDVRAEAPVPIADYSAMDGYAVRSEDFASASEVELPIAGEIFAGAVGLTDTSLAPGRVARIFTGAPLPAGADAVIMQENVERLEGRIRTRHRPVPFEHVRRAGEDLQLGAIGLSKGLRVTPFSVGLLATLERVEVRVAARPRVGILCTGDELRAPGRPGAPGLAESNSVSLAALVRSVGGMPERLPLVMDSLEATQETLRRAVQRFDLVLTVGGVSVGDHDFVRPALEALGAETLFSKVNIKPGKPVTLQRIGACAVLGLPGNPASAQVTMALFGLPLLRLLQGDHRAFPQWRSAVLEEPLQQKPGRTSFSRAVLEGERVRVLANQASGASTATAWANCLLMVSSEVASLEAGAKVPVLAYVDL